MSFPRSSGILLHPTSLPGRFGSGDLGQEAYDFVDFLVDCGQTLWQILPLGPPGYGNSPYQCFSAFAGNIYLINPERLVADELLIQDELARAPHFPADHVAFGQVIEYRQSLLDRAFENFRRQPQHHLRGEFDYFCHQTADWLNDYALFMALKATYGDASWNTWETRLIKREPATIAYAREQFRDQIEAQKFYQYLFFRQWLALKEYCRARGVKIVGDIPIFVAYNSADVWTNPELFKLDENGQPIVISGVPPDLFSETGQLWGNPLYDWDRMQATGYDWWIKRIRMTLELVDIVRIDHFRGFAACWEVPAGEETAERGRWVEVPGREFFTALKGVFEELPIIAEDLGLITPDVEALRDHFGIPGMKVLQFAFGDDHRNPYLPHNYHQNALVYTGTHDTDTTVGWFQSQGGNDSTLNAEQIAHEQRHCLKYLGTDGREIHWDFIRAAFASVANLAILPLQDLLGLDSSARMNLPGSPDGNWSWRFQAEALTDEVRARLREMTELYGRLVNK